MQPLLQIDWPVLADHTTCPSDPAGLANPVVPQLLVTSLLLLLRLGWWYEEKWSLDDASNPLCYCYYCGVGIVVADTAQVAAAVVGT